MKDPVRESTADREAYNLSFIRSDEGLKQVLDELDDLYERSSEGIILFSGMDKVLWWKKKSKKGNQPMVVIVRDEKKKLMDSGPLLKGQASYGQKGFGP